MKVLSKFQNFKGSFPNDQTPVIIFKFLCPGSLLDIKEIRKQTNKQKTLTPFQTTIQNNTIQETNCDATQKAGVIQM